MDVLVEYIFPDGKRLTTTVGQKVTEGWHMTLDVYGVIYESTHVKKVERANGMVYEVQVVKSPRARMQRLGAMYTQGGKFHLYACHYMGIHYRSLMNDVSEGDYCLEAGHCALREAGQAGFLQLSWTAQSGLLRE